jgi:spore maturation protein CgeB
LQELKEKVLYYLQHPVQRLQIAKAGWRVAMQQHQMYHEMEKVFFGSILSPQW